MKLSFVDASSKRNLIVISIYCNKITKITNTRRIKNLYIISILYNMLNEGFLIVELSAMIKFTFKLLNFEESKCM